MGAPDVQVHPEADFAGGEIETAGVQSIPFMQPTGEVAMALCAPAANMSFNIHMTAGGSHGVIALAMDGDGGLAGIYAPIAATELRSLAASFLRAADVIDGGKGKQ